MCGCADADGAAMTDRRACRGTGPRRTAYTRAGSRPERRQPAAQALLQVDLGLPAEHFARARDVGPPHLRVVRQVVRRRLERDLARRAGDADHRLRELEHRQLVIRVADVHRQVLSGLGERHEPADRVVHVAEAARL